MNGKREANFLGVALLSTLRSERQKTPLPCDPGGDPIAAGSMRLSASTIYHFGTLSAAWNRFSDLGRVVWNKKADLVTLSN